MPTAGGARRFHLLRERGFRRRDSSSPADRHDLAGVSAGESSAERSSRRGGWRRPSLERGAVVTLLAPRLDRATPARETDGPVVVRRFLLRAAPTLGGRHLDSFLWWCVCISSWLWRNRRSYDLIYVVHGRLHAFPAAIAGTRLGKPILVKPGRGGEAHFDLSVVQRKRLLGSFFARRIARNTTAWVANSREITADLARWGVPRERVHAIPNGIDVPEDGGRQSSNGVVRFLSMGRLDAEKAVDQTIRAFAALPADTRARLTILGDGPCRQELEALSRRLGQDRRIAFPGAVADVTPYLREADVYLSTSVSEGMSNALLEAMSYGVMPIVSRVSGADDLVEEGSDGAPVRAWRRGRARDAARGVADDDGGAPPRHGRGGAGGNASPLLDRPSRRTTPGAVSQTHRGGTMRESLTQRTLKGAAWIGGASVARLASARYLGRRPGAALDAARIRRRRGRSDRDGLRGDDLRTWGLAPTLIQRKDVRPDHVATAFSSALAMAVVAAVGMWYAAPLIAELLAGPGTRRRS